MEFLDEQGLKTYDEKIKTYIQDDIEKLKTDVHEDILETTGISGGDELDGDFTIIQRRHPGNPSERQNHAYQTGGTALGGMTVAGVTKEEYDSGTTDNPDKYKQWDGTKYLAYEDTFGFNFAQGDRAKARGRNAAAFNLQTQAEGKNSVAMGDSTIANGLNSISSGYHTTANGENSISSGYYTTAAGVNSAAFGNNTKSSSDNKMVVGQWNEDIADAIFEVGRGTNNGWRRNALTVKTDGTTVTQKLLPRKGDNPDIGGAPDTEWYNNFHTRNVYAHGSLNVNNKLTVDSAGILKAAAIESNKVPTYDTDVVRNKELKAAVASMEDKIKTSVSSLLKYKGTKERTADLPTSGNIVGDVWNITNACAASGTLPKVNAGDNVAWNGSSWDVLAGVVDLSEYYTRDSIDDLIYNLDQSKAATNHEHNDLYYTKSQIDNTYYTKSHINDTYYTDDEVDAIADALASDVDTKLSSKAANVHTHSADDITSTVPVNKGGTGATTAKAAQYNLLSDMNQHGDAVNDNTRIGVAYSQPDSTKGAIAYKPMSMLWTYIVSRIKSVFGFNSSNILQVSSGGTGTSSAGATALSNIGLKSKRVIIKVNKSASTATESQGASGYYNLGVKASFCVATITGCGNSEAAAKDSVFATLPTANFAQALPVIYTCAESTTSDKTLVCIKHGRPVTSDIYYQVDILYI